MPELNALMTETPKNEPVYTEELLEYLEFIKAHQAAELRFALNLALMKQGMPDFLSKTVTPLNKLVGDAWLRGEVLVFEEHLYSEQITSVLRAANTIIRDHAGTPRVLLTTLPGEEHNLGLLMAEATLGLAGAQCTMLGVQTPIGEIVLAARAHQADIVALSFTMVMPPLQIKSGLQQLRQALPREVALWAGGSGVSRQRKQEDGVQLMGELSELTEAVGAWRAARSE